MATTPPGWYDDGRGALRWWDGRQWTEHVQTPDPEPAADGVPVAPAPTLGGAPGAPGAPGVPAAPAVPGVHDAPGVSGVPAAPFETPVAPGYGTVPSAPPGYPGGFPGGPAPSGGFIAATEPKKSKLWILWVVLGVVLLGIVILIAVLVPLVIGLFGSAASSGGGVDPGDADESAAVATVRLYDDAWSTGDCDLFIEATTEDLRFAQQLTECEDFTAAAADFSASVEDYTVTVTSIERDDDEITVQTSETYGSFLDEEGNPVDVSIPAEDLYEYTLVRSADGWVIDDLDSP